jgi:hypothetical protein
MLQNVRVKGLIFVLQKQVEDFLFGQDFTSRLEDFEVVIFKKLVDFSVFFRPQDNVWLDDAYRIGDLNQLRFHQLF